MLLRTLRGPRASGKSHKEAGEDKLEFGKRLARQVYFV